MSRYKSSPNQPRLGLLNFEGDIFVAYRTSDTNFVVLDDKREVMFSTDSVGILNILSGRIGLTTSDGRTYDISKEHQDARPKQHHIDKFLGLVDEYDLEHWENVDYRIREEGIDYCFENYSNWDEIKDKKFHKLREQLLKSMSEMRVYVRTKVEYGRERE